MGGALTRKETVSLQPELSSWKEALPELSVRKLCFFTCLWFVTKSWTCLWGCSELPASCTKICARREGEMPWFGAAAMAE